VFSTLVVFSLQAEQANHAKTGRSPLVRESVRYIPRIRLYSTRMFEYEYDMELASCVMLHLSIKSVKNVGQ
jgi:hypothetical protein